MQNEFTTKHDELRRVSNDFGENNDCTVHAVAIVTGVTYEVAHHELEQRGRKKGHGSNSTKWLPAVNALGCKHTEVTGHFSGKTMNSLEAELPKGEKFLIRVSGHLIGFDGHAIQDYTKGRRYRVKNIYHVVADWDEPMPEKKRALSPMRTTELEDCIFIWEHPKEYRIHIRENGKVRWLNSKYDLYECEEAAHRAAYKRGISYAGERDPNEINTD